MVDIRNNITCMYVCMYVLHICIYVCNTMYVRTYVWVSVSGLFTCKVLW